MSNRVAFLLDRLGCTCKDRVLKECASLCEGHIGAPVTIFAPEHAANTALPDFLSRFTVVLLQSPGDVDRAIQRLGITVVYTTSTSLAQWPTACRVVLHLLENPANMEVLSSPNVNVMVADASLNDRLGTQYRVLPLCVNGPCPDVHDDLRARFNIPNDAVVFGAYSETLEMQEAKAAILWVASNLPASRFFLLWGVQPFGPSMPNVIFIEQSTPEAQQMFVNTCDALVHARVDGDALGLECAEFASTGRRVITWKRARSRGHIGVLGRNAVVFDGFADLCGIFMSRALPRIPVVYPDPVRTTQVLCQLLH